MPKLKAEKMSEAWDNKPRSKTRLQLQFAQREPVLSLHKSQSYPRTRALPTTSGCFLNSYKPANCRGCSARSDSHGLQQRSPRPARDRRTCPCSAPGLSGLR